jgi:hypothetical protein
MRSLWETTALLGLAVLLTACEPAPPSTPAPNTPSSNPGNVVTPPPAPAPTPTPASYKVTLNWTAPATRANGRALLLSELSGYRIYYIREGSDASDDVTLTVKGGNTTSYNLTLTVPGSYTFAVTAVDLLGLESPLSGEVTVPIN